MDIYREIMIFTKAISHLLKDIDCNTPTPQKTRLETSHYMEEYQSKFLYKKILTRKTDVVQSEQYWKTYFKCELDFSEIYMRKIHRIKEKKLMEFNFKVIHRILCCKRNLFIWKIDKDDKCDVCGQSQNILHLLYNCQHATKVWSLITKVYGINITEEEIICGCNDENMNFIICFIEFIIYKEWIVCKNEGTKRTENFVILLKSELNYRKQIYKCIGWDGYYQSLQSLYNML